MPTSQSKAQALIVGAGPTGLVLALWLTRMGIRVRIIDKTAEPGTTSRAMAVQARTLELYDQLGLSEEVVDRGHKLDAINLWVRGKAVAHAVFGSLGVGLSPYPDVIIYPQDEHERLLIERLSVAGVQVERLIEMTRFQDDGDGVTAYLKNGDGNVETCRFAYLAGCDGARSIVRETLGVGFPGGSYEHLFYVADVAAQGPAINGELQVALDTTDFLAVFPLKQPGHARLIGTVREAFEHHHDHLSWSDVSKQVLEWMRIEVVSVNWFSTYRVYHRVANRFRAGRAFLLGDAAHIHSPVGGQGMNTGIGDAINLAWKLSDVLHEHAPISLLDTYEPERIAFARRLVATTDRAFTAVTSRGTIARQVRLNLVPLIFPFLFRIGAARRLLFRTVSQTAVNYRGSGLSVGRSSGVQGGDRLPWVAGESKTGADNFAPLRALQWQLHIYGDSRPEMTAFCQSRGLPLQLFAWRPLTEQAGLQRDAAYLVRPDGYVAWTDPQATVAALQTYLDQRGLLRAPSAATTAG
jgi:2-polyprenyl-6-methoxyphenol hydroxylase-like FAD-dependent oxidoreductase